MPLPSGPRTAIQGSGGLSRRRISAAANRSSVPDRRQRSPSEGAQPHRPAQLARPRRRLLGPAQLGALPQAAGPAAADGGPQDAGQLGAVPAGRLDDDVAVALLEEASPEQAGEPAHQRLVREPRPGQPGRRLLPVAQHPAVIQVGGSPPLQRRQQVDVTPVVEQAGDVRPAGDEQRRPQLGDQLPLGLPGVGHQQVDVAAAGQVREDVVVAEDHVRPERVEGAPQRRSGNRTIGHHRSQGVSAGHLAARTTPRRRPAALPSSPIQRRYRTPPPPGRTPPGRRPHPPTSGDTP